MHLHAQTNRASHSVQRTLMLAVALVSGGAAVAACGGSPSASVANLGSGSSTTTTTTTPGSALGSPSPKSAGGAPAGGQSSTLTTGGVTVQYAQCMRTHGVPTFPDPNGQGQVTMTGVNPQSSSFVAAQRTCATYAKGGGKPPSAAKQQQAVAQALKFSECMRSHGITNFPDPQVSSSGGGTRIGISLGGGGKGSSNLNPDNPQFQAAQKACQALLPSAPPGSSSASAG
jgi:hypothetical protein